MVSRPVRIKYFYQNLHCLVYSLAASSQNPALLFRFTRRRSAEESRASSGLMYILGGVAAARISAVALSP